MRSVLVLLLSWPLLAAAAPAPPGDGALARPRPGAAPAVVYRYEVIPERSRVSFSFRGGLFLPQEAFFGLVRGEILLSGGADPFGGASGWIRVETGSVKASDPLQEVMLRGHVLEAERHPGAELRVAGAKPLGPPGRRGRERDWEVEARGTLLLHGERREVALRFEVDDTGADLYVRGEGDLSLSDFGMPRPTTLLLVPGSDVVRVSVRLVARPAPRPGRP